MAASGIGAGIGSVVGGIAGSIVPGLGTAVGASIGGAVGGGIGSAVDASKNKAQQPPMVDPNQLALLNEMNQRRKALMTGAGVQSGINQVNQATAQTQNVISRNTGGDIGNTISGLLQAQRVGGQNINQVLGGANQQQQFFTTLADQLNGKIADRKLGLQQYEYGRQLAQQAENSKNNMTNLGSLATSPEIQDLLKRMMGGGSGLAAMPNTQQMGISNPSQIGSSNIMPQSGNINIPLDLIQQVPTGAPYSSGYGTSMLSTIGQ